MKLTMPTTITSRVDDELVKLIDKIAQDEGMDRSTVIRRFLKSSTKEWLIITNLKKYEEGKITLWQAAEECEVSIWEIITEAKKRGIKIPYDKKEFQEDLKGLL